jgi:predicted phosphodiesterase
MTSRFLRTRSALHPNPCAAGLLTRRAQGHDRRRGHPRTRRVRRPAAHSELAVVAAALLIALSGAALALAADPAPPADEFKPFVFILAGDPELGKPDDKSTADRFALLPKRASAIKASLVVIPGDMTHDDTDAQWKLIDDTLKQFTMPVKMVPGNHDKSESFAKHVGEDHFVFTLNNCDFVCLNSNLVGGSSGKSTKAKAQMEWFEKTLKDSREHNRTHTFVVMHHPVANDEPIRGLLVKYGVKVVLAGHLHKTQEIRGKGFVTYVSPGTARFRDEGGLGYRVFKVYKDRIEQEFVPLEKEVAAVKLAP